jgi:hypothetical protein
MALSGAHALPGAGEPVQQIAGPVSLQSTLKTLNHLDLTN